MTDRYIYLNDSIIDREKFSIALRDEKVAGRLNVLLDNGRTVTLDGDDARLFWTSMGAEKDFYKE